MTVGDGISRASLLASSDSVRTEGHIKVSGRRLVGRSTAKAAPRHPAAQSDRPDSHNRRSHPDLRFPPKLARCARTAGRCVGERRSFIPSSAKATIHSEVAERRGDQELAISFRRHGTKRLLASLAPARCDLMRIDERTPSRTIREQLEAS